MKKRIISLLLVLCMIPFIPYTVLAEDQTSNGNLALGKSYTISGDGKGYGAYTADLTDGLASDDITTLFNDDWFSFHYDLNYSDPNVDNTENGYGTVVVDLGEITEVGKVRLHLGNNFGAAVYAPGNASVSVSSDNSTFEVLGYFDVHHIDTSGYYDLITYWTELEFDSVSARYVKIDLKTVYYHTFINEIEVFAPAEQKSRGTNLALNADYTLSGDGTGYGPYTADLTDGTASNDVTTLFNDDWLSFYYVLNNYDPDVYNTENGYGTIIVDLGAEAELNNVRLHLGNNFDCAVYAPSEATVSVSSDGETYLKAGYFEVRPIDDHGKNDNLAYWTEVELLEITARYVKIDLKAAFYHTFINEIEVYGKKLPAESLVGDIDGNGRRNANDYLILKRAVVGLYELDFYAEQRADINGNGKIEAVDYIMLKRYCLGKYDIDDSRFDGDSEYKNIVREEAKGYKYELFAVENSNIVLELYIPSDWNVSENINGESVLTQAEKEIGYVISGEADDLDIWKTVNVRNVDLYGIVMKEYAERSDSGFRYRYTYTYTENNESRILTFIINCEEVSETTAINLLNQVSLTKTSRPTGMGTLSDLQNGDLLILGNSFIGSSNIGEILSEMLGRNGKSNPINAVSRGYATVSTYVADTAMIRDIESGMYDAVFICGFYGESELTYLSILAQSCKNSDTELVVFPAHNEAHAIIDKVRVQFPELTVLDWQREIDMLIEQGIDKWELCINDAHLHSTPLAGYVGAHQIYRAIYGEVPAVDMETAISQSYVDSILGDYADHGVLNYVDLGYVNIIK